MPWNLDIPIEGSIIVEQAQDFTQVRVEEINIRAPSKADRNFRVEIVYTAGYLSGGYQQGLRKSVLLTDAQSKQFLALPTKGSNFTESLEEAVFLALTTLGEIGSGTRT